MSEYCVGMLYKKKRDEFGARLDGTRRQQFISFRMWMKNNDLRGRTAKWQIRSKGPEILALQLQEIVTGLASASWKFWLQEDI